MFTSTTIHVVLSYPSTKDFSDDARLIEVLKVLVQAVHPNVKEVTFEKIEDNHDGSTDVWIKAPLNKHTQDKLEEALKQVFGKTFKISSTGVSRRIRKDKAIDDAITQFL